jgi:hypothetical protein
LLIYLEILCPEFDRSQMVESISPFRIDRCPLIPILYEDELLVVVAGVVATRAIAS